MYHLFYKKKGPSSDYPERRRSPCKSTRYKYILKARGTSYVSRKWTTGHENEVWSDLFGDRRTFQD